MRNIKVINSGWLFSKNAKSAPSNLPTDWEALDLPFTWNGKDGQDGGNDYYRGTCYFAKEIKADELPEGEVKFSGMARASQSTTVVIQLSVQKSKILKMLTCSLLQLTTLQMTEFIHNRLTLHSMAVFIVM